MGHDDPRLTRRPPAGTARCGARALALPWARLVAALSSRTNLPHRTGLATRGGMAALSAAELRAFERDGFVTIDTPLTEAQLDQAEEAWDRVRAGQVFNSRGQPRASSPF